MTLQFPRRQSDCRQMEALLPPFVDGEASPSARTEVERHLAGCQTCREDVEAQRAVRTLLRARRPQLVDQAPPVLQAELRRVASTGVAPRPRWTPLAAAAALVAALTGAGAWATGSSSVLLAAQLTLDHLKCFVIDGDDHGAPMTAAEAHDRFQQKFSMDVDVPEPAPGGRARLVSVRECLYGEGWIGHALYRVDGEEVSLFVLERERDAASIDGFGRRAEVLSRDGRAYVIVSPGHVAGVAAALGLGAE